MTLDEYNMKVRPNEARVRVAKDYREQMHKHLNFLRPVMSAKDYPLKKEN